MSLSLQSTSDTFTTAVVEGDKAETIAPVVSGTAVTASGTAVTFTGIPAWVKRVTFLFSGLSTNGNSGIRIRLGTVGGLINTGYASSNTSFAAAISTANNTDGFYLYTGSTAADVRHGRMTLSLLASNTWVEDHMIGFSNAANGNMGAGSINVGAALTQVQISTANGTDVFDAGTVNITWE